MIRIWGRNNSINVQKAMWACAEAGLEVERIDVGGAFGGLDTPEYLALNPNRRIPTLEDDGLVLWESNVIVRYVAARYAPGRLSPEAPGPRALAEQWMDWEQTTLIPTMFPVFWGLIRTPPEKRDWEAIRAGEARLKDLFAIVDAQLARQPYLGGESFTMGDIPVGAATHRWLNLEVEHPALPHLAAWHERLSARPPYRQHVALPVT